MLLKDKVVLVTGGSRNVGAGIVRSLAREGATVVINCLQSVDLANALADSIREQGGKAGVRQCDVRDWESCRKMIDDIVEEHGRIDAVVNNASSGADTGEWDPEHWHNFTNCFEGEVKFVFNTVNAVRAHMKEQGGGRIVNIITEQWNEGSGYASHNAAKAGVVSFSRWLVPKLGPENITVNMVAPGWTRTEGTPEDANDSPYAQRTPLRRIAEPEDIGDACVFLISDLGKYVSGAYIQMNGGRHPQMGN